MQIIYPEIGVNQRRRNERREIRKRNGVITMTGSTIKYEEDFDCDLDVDENLGFVTHPINGRKIKVWDAGTYEPDTNAYISDDGYPMYVYADTEEELSWDELNERYSDSHYLHEWLLDNVEWY